MNIKLGQLMVEIQGYVIIFHTAVQESNVVPILLFPKIISIFPQSG